MIHSWKTLCSLSLLHCSMGSFINSPMNNEIYNYRQMLQAEFESKIKARGSFTLRAFAQYLSVSPSLLSDVLKGRKNLSQETAFKVCQKLKFSDLQRQYFLTSIKCETTKSMELKSELHDQLRQLTSDKTVYDLSVEMFRMISDWYHYAILEYTDTNQDTSDETLAKQFNISIHEVRSAVDRLIRLELVEKDEKGQLKRVRDNLLVQSKNKNEALQKFHSQMLEKATVAIKTQTNEERLIGSETLPFDVKDLQEVNQILEECFNKVVALSKRQKNKKDVYHLGIQFFRLNKETGVKK